jgi:hypothetical protein
MNTTITDTEKTVELIRHDAKVLLEMLAQPPRFSEIRFLRNMKNWVTGFEHDLEQVIRELEAT